MPLSLEHQVLQESKVVAMVGLSDNPQRPSHRVASYLMNHGYRVIPVNPALKEFLGEPAYPDVAAIPFPVDVVDIFRKAEDVPPIVEQAIARGAKAVWMQEGIVNEEAAARARQAGLKVVMDHCMLREHSRMTSLSV
jgi:predicted CoA-binding protein